MLSAAHRPARKYLGLLACAVLLSAAASLGIAYAVRSVDNAVATVHRSAATIAAANDVIASMQDMVAAQQSYPSSGDPQVARAYRRTSAALDRQLADLRDATWDDPWESAQVDRTIASLRKALAAAQPAMLTTGGGAAKRLPPSEIARLRLEIRAVRDHRLRLNALADVAARRDGARAIVVVLLAASGIALAGLVEIGVLRRFRARVAREAAQVDRRFEATFEEAAVGIAHVSPDGRWLRVNGQLSAITRYSREELLAGSFQQITHPDDLSQDLEHVEALLAGDRTRYTMDKRYIRKDGEVIWVSLTVTLIRDAEGQPDFFVSVIQDISERRALDASLKASEERYRAVFDSAAEAIAVIDTGGMVQSVNPAVQSMFGYAPAELIGRSIRCLLADSGEKDQGPADPSPDPHAALGTSREVRCKRKDGTPLTIDLSVAEWQLGGETFYTGIMRDISERQVSERALRSSQERLQALQNEYAHLARVNEMGEMAAAIAHEINQPLTAIVNNLNAGLYATAEGYSPEVFAEAEEVMSEAAGQALRAGEIVRRLREFIGKGSGDRRAEQVDAVVDAAAKLALIDAAANGIEIERVAGAGSAEAQVDPVQIQQVLVNVIRNAVDALVTLPAERKRRLTIETRQSETAVEIRIADTGPGIVPDVRERLFEPFVTSKKNGMGMGLSVCRRLMEAHGGSIALGDTTEGTEFRLILPRYGSLSPDV